MLGSALIAWRIIATGLAEYAVDRLREGESRFLEDARIWNADHPETLYRRALAVRDRDPEAARRWLIAAYRRNPGDGRPLLAMADLVVREDRSRADALVERAVTLVPADPRIHRRAAEYWVRRGDMTRALAQWSLALEADPLTHSRIFPILLRVAESPDLRAAFQPLAAAPPSWWEGFFEEAAERATSVEAVQFLYNARLKASKAPILDGERRAYVARLLQEGLIDEAYLHWVNGLDAKGRGYLGLIYDGGFESEPDHWGFGWYFRDQPGVLIDRASTYGIEGKQALHLLFQGMKRPFHGVYQRLFLVPGFYRIDGQVRTDSLDSPGGLLWQIRCLYPEIEVLGTSERFLGSNRWKPFRFEFRVPVGCRLQELALVSGGDQPQDREILGGGIWFDRLRIHPIPKLSRPPRTH